MADFSLVATGRVTSLTRKTSRDPKTKEESVYYQIKLDYLGGSLWLNCDEQLGTELVEGDTYQCGIGGYFREYAVNEWDSKQGREVRRTKNLFTAGRLLGAKPAAVENLVGIERKTRSKAAA